MLLLVVQVFHCFYYGILYPTMFADFDYNIYDIIQKILENPYHIPPTKDDFLQISMFMKHFGLNLQ